MATNYYTEADKLIKKQEEEQVALGEKKKEEVNTQLDQQIAKAESDVQLKKGDLQRDYEDIVDATAIQKELDRRQIAETMANLGLTRSGLNASQQMAVELSAGNKTAAAQRQRQAAVDSLTRSLAEYKMEVENTRRESMNSIDEGVQSSIAQYRADRYKEATDATSADHKATLDYNYKMTELGMKQAENEAKEGERLINKAFRLNSWDNNIFEYYDSASGTLKKVNADTLAMMISLQEDMAIDKAEALVGRMKDSFVYGDKANYHDIKSFSGKASTFDKLMLGAMTLPKDVDDFENYKTLYGGEGTEAGVRKDFMVRVLSSGISYEEQAAILVQIGATEDEVKAAQDEKQRREQA